MEPDREQIRREIESVRVLFDISLDEEFSGLLLNLIAENTERGRLARYLDKEVDTSLVQYIRLVIRNYREQHKRVEGLQIGRDSTLWETLYGQVRSWVYDYLCRHGFMPNEGTFRLVDDYTSFTVEELLLSHFPYDIDFDRWARTLAQNTCSKYIARAMRQKRAPDRHQVGLEQWHPASSASVHEEWLLIDEATEEMKQLLWKLPGSFRTVLLLRYYESLDYVEIAEVMGRSLKAVYNLHFKAIARLREILPANEYNTLHGSKQSGKRPSRQDDLLARPTHPEDPQ